MKEIDEILSGKLNKDFSFPDALSFEVAGVRFRIDEDPQSPPSFFGPDVRLWADDVMIFKHRKIDTPGGMGQVEHTYSKLQLLRVRVDRLRKVADLEAREAKKQSVIERLVGPEALNAA